MNIDKPSNPTLKLTLKKKWFDMILSGEKKEEYREIKPYWEKRLYHPLYPEVLQFANYDYVEFKNGYGSDVPTIVVELLEIDLGYGVEQWGAIGEKEYFILRLGDVVYVNSQT